MLFTRPSLLSSPFAPWALCKQARPRAGVCQVHSGGRHSQAHCLREVSGGGPTQDIPGDDRQ